MTTANLLGGRYALGEVIGRGGMAEVRHGTDVRLGRDVAVKVLRVDLATDPSFQGRFRREAQSAASLDAPTVVAVYDTGEDDRGVPWIVMEYVDGRTLRDILTTEGRLLPLRALEVTADICSALEVAHAAGMVHRDIKPGNVMLTSRGEVKVMDFGIARAAAGHESTMTQTQSVIGTAAYLSPEQARGEHVDARSDVYSTGCLLYELVTGSVPFVGDSPVAVAYQHVREDPVPPSEFDSTLSPEMAKALDSIILKAMAKNPANRYQSADEMREDLLRGVAGQPVLATPVLDRQDQTWVEEAEPQRPRRGMAVYAIAAIAAVALGIISGLFVHAVLGTPSDLIKPPPLIGLPEQQALTQLASYGLNADKPIGIFHKEPVGTVIDQTPDEHFFIKKGGKVQLTISMGLRQTSVPAVVGQTQAQAEADLTAAKLRFTLAVRDLRAPAGQVLSIAPHPGTQLVAGTTVVLYVASGNVAVPNTVGQLQDAAIDNLLGPAGFGIGIQQEASSLPAGTVISQTPSGGTAPLGSDVVIIVAYDPNATPTPNPSGTPGSTGTTGPTDGGTPTPTRTP